MGQIIHVAGQIFEVRKLEKKVKTFSRLVSLDGLYRSNQITMHTSTFSRLATVSINFIDWQFFCQGLT